MTPRMRRTLEFILDNLVWFMLLSVLAIFSATVPNYFQIGIFTNIIEQSSVLGVMSIGLALVIISGQMDLSVESVAALSAMATGILFCQGGIGLGVTLTPAWLVVPVSLALSLAVGASIGALNGYLIVKVKMNAFIVTLAAFIWVRGLVVAISGGRSAQDLAPAIRWLGIQRLAGIPLTAWIAISCFVVFTFVMSKTRFGRHLLIIGGNEAAAFRAGIAVSRIMITAFVLAGTVAALPAGCWRSAPRAPRPISGRGCCSTPLRRS